MPTPKKKKSFIDVMSEVYDLDRKEVVDELSMATDMNNGIRCPVPNCSSKTVFKRWGDMRGHFLDDSTHKKDYFRVFFERMHEPYCDNNGPGFNHGVNSLMLALIRQPTTIEDIESEKSSNKKTPAKVTDPSPVVISRAKKVRPVQEQQMLLPAASAAPMNLSEPSVTLFEQVASEASKKSYRSAFSEVSEYIRDSDEINKIWRGKVLEEYVDMFHGIPPCFHCRSEEGKQIHHQNPLFHEIVLISLNKLGTTAEEVVDKRINGDEEPLKAVLKEVFAYHLKPGRVCAVPYCQGCNQDAENKRRRNKKNSND